MLRLPERFKGIGLDTVTSTGMAFYLIPWGDLHYVGPWDSPSDGRREDFRATDQEIDAILNELALMFPTFGLSRKDVVFSWAGARPRTAQEGQPLGSMEVLEHDLTNRECRTSSCSPAAC